MTDERGVLRVRGLRKSYGDTEVLRGISFEVREGEIVGLVGRNGAGKTTFLECVEGIRRPDAGDIDIGGTPPSIGPTGYHALFGVQLQEASLPDRLRLREVLRLFAGFYDDPWDIDDLIARVGLAERHRAFYRQLSAGQKRRLTLALAVLGRPPLVLLDEPTASLDPHARLELWELLRGLAGDRTAILLATHDLHEAQENCDRVCVLESGRIVADGTVPELLRADRIVSRLRTVDRPWLDGLLPTVPGLTTSHVVAGTRYAYGDEDFARNAVLALKELARHDQRVPDGVHNPSEVLASAITGPAGLEDIYLTRTGKRYEHE